MTGPEAIEIIENTVIKEVVIVSPEVFDAYEAYLTPQQQYSDVALRDADIFNLMRGGIPVIRGARAPVKPNTIKGRRQ